VQWAVELVKEQAEAKRGDEPADEYVAKFVLVKDPNKYVPCTPWLHPWLLPCPPPSPPCVQCTHVTCVCARGGLPLLPSVCRWGNHPMSAATNSCSSLLSSGWMTLPPLVKLTKRGPFALLLCCVCFCLRRPVLSLYQVDASMFDEVEEEGAAGAGAGAGSA
jgi:hypothetical protein